MYLNKEQKIFTDVHDGIILNFVFSFIFLEANRTLWIVISILADGNKHTKLAWWPIPKCRCLKLMEVQKEKKKKVSGGAILGDMAGKGNNAKVWNTHFIPFSPFLSYIGCILSQEAICHFRLLSYKKIRFQIQINKSDYKSVRF